MEYIDSLRIFCAVVEMRSFTGAADMLGCSRAVISRAVAHLEKRLGVRLFNRTTRHLSLTEAAENFYAGCTHVLESLDELEAHLSMQAKEPVGLLRLVAHTTATTNLLMPLIESFKLKQPKVNLDVTLTERSVDMVADGFDVALVPGHMLSTDMTVTRLLRRVPFTIVASPEYLERRPMPEHPSDLEQHTFVALSRSISNPNLTFLLGDERFSVPVHHEIASNNATVVHSLVQKGFGLGVLPIVLVVDDISSGRLVRLLDKFKIAEAEAELRIAYSSRALLPAKVRAFIEHSVAHFEQISEDFAPR